MDCEFRRHSRTACLSVSVDTGRPKARIFWMPLTHSSSMPVSWGSVRVFDENTCMAFHVTEFQGQASRKSNPEGTEGSCVLHTTASCATSHHSQLRLSQHSQAHPGSRGRKADSRYVVQLCESLRPGPGLRSFTGSKRTVAVVQRKMRPPVQSPVMPSPTPKG